MKKLIFMSFGIVILTISACKKNDCDCSETWVDDCDLTYYPGDLISHEGVCYSAYAQGKACAVEPGTSEGDIWEVCD
jgi:hypothetical protein